ncbi:hypothetical protein psal_cds_1294 [Pandoravirus salinus]|uniref:Uncharacterized protein n=1 Tax=Pandoravirus salinus TaxID=1349410 RepID=S4VZ71_9VIRU|nr:hypothetical protein psal_cds_1294 [Pandoravirus salinus]AGO85663.1 hypothetical protein psal_cds_1294 [Pandoravirus salinus]
MPSLTRASPLSARGVAGAFVCDLTGDGPLGSPDHYHDVVTTLVAMGASSCQAAPHRTVDGSLGVRPSIAKPRPLPVRPRVARRASTAPPNGTHQKHTRQQQHHQRQKQHSVPPALAALYLDGVRAVASWSRTASTATAHTMVGAACGDPCACGPMCLTPAGAMDCDALDATDIEGSLRLRLASIEEAFEYQAARRLVAALNRMVAGGTVHAVALHRPLWSRPTCLACTAACAPPRPSPVRAAHRYAETATCLSDATDVATSLSSFGGATTTATAKQTDAAPFATLDRVCVYAATRAVDGSVIWTARRRNDADRTVGSTATPTEPSLCTAPVTGHGAREAQALQSAVVAPSAGGSLGCVRCAAGKCIRGVAPSAPASGDVVNVDVGEVVGALAANLWEGIAGSVISISGGPEHRYRTLWSGVPGERPTTGLLDASAVPSATWLATETRALAVGSVGRCPASGSDALYACARIAYATARLADTTARQRAAHVGAPSDPRHPRPATPLSYGPSMDSPLAALAWMRGVASVFGATVDADGALSASVVSYRMHVLARDLERTPLTPIEPSRLPDEVRDLAHQLQASLRSPGTDQPNNDEGNSHKNNSDNDDDDDAKVGDFESDYQGWFVHSVFGPGCPQQK